MRWTLHGRWTRGACAVACFVIARLTLPIAGRSRRIRVAAAQLALAHLFPRALCVLLGTAHARREVLQAVHVQSPAPVAGRDDAFAFGQTLHPVHHFHLEGASVVFLGLLASALARSWEEVGRRVGYRNRRVHHGMQLRLVQRMRGSCNWLLGCWRALGRLCSRSGWDCRRRRRVRGRMAAHRRSPRFGIGRGWLRRRAAVIDGVKLG